PADVRALHLPPELGAVLLWDRRRRLRPVRKTLGRIDDARLVERSGRARLDAERARAAVELERGGRFDVRSRDKRPEHDPGAVSAGDQHRVLAVEADTGPCRRLAVDVLVRVDEDTVLAAE